MKTVSSISGGRTSAYMLANYPSDYNVFSLVCIEAKDLSPDPKMVQWVNDKLGGRYISLFGEFKATAEDDLTLYAVRDLEQLTGKEITWIRGKSFEDVIMTKNTHGGIPTMLPNKHYRICTNEMKMVAIFYWWLWNIGEKVKMNVGFRFDEYNRVEKFFNKNPTMFSVPTACRTYGEKKQIHTNFNWRDVSFPLVKDGVNKLMVNSYWAGKPVKFPVISNCVGCHQKTVEDIALEWNENTAKMEWFSALEKIDKGTWIKGVTYDEIRKNSANFIAEMVREQGGACDSEGCTD